MAGPVHDPALYRERDAIPVRRALISVSDKTGLLDLAAALAGAGVEIVSTGSTAATIGSLARPGAGPSTTRSALPAATCASTPGCGTRS